jgi:hypothetical protein
MFVVVVTVFVCTALAATLGFVLSKLAINIIHNTWFSSLEESDKHGLQQVVSYIGAAAVGAAVFFGYLVQQGANVQVLKAFLWVMFVWQLFLWGISIFLAVSRWLGQKIDSLTRSRS